MRSFTWCIYTIHWLLLIYLAVWTRQLFCGDGTCFKHPMCSLPLFICVYIFSLHFLLTSLPFGAVYHRKDHSICLPLIPVKRFVWFKFSLMLEPSTSKHTKHSSINAVCAVHYFEPLTMISIQHGTIIVKIQIYLCILCENAFSM